MAMFPDNWRKPPIGRGQSQLIQRAELQGHWKENLCTYVQLALGAVTLAQPEIKPGHLQLALLIPGSSISPVAHPWSQPTSDLIGLEYLLLGKKKKQSVYIQVNPCSSNPSCSRHVSPSSNENDLVILSLCVNYNHRERCVLASVQHHGASRRWKNNLLSPWPCVPTAFSLEGTRKGRDTFLLFSCLIRFTPTPLPPTPKKIATLLRQLIFPVIPLSKFTFCVNYFAVHIIVSRTAFISLK